ncbi:unnamed protein product, partial [Staurois parvus]
DVLPLQRSVVHCVPVSEKAEGVGLVISAYQCTYIPHISAHLSCLSLLVSVAYECCQSVPPISARQCHLTVPVSATYQCRPYMSTAFQCPSVMSVNAHQCHLPVYPHQCPSAPPINAHQCCLISAHHCSLISAHQ